MLLEQGRVEDFLRMFYTLLAADITHETLSACEWTNNTHPQNPSICSLVRMYRTMMIEERDGGLYLLQGVPRRWLEQDKQIGITERPRGTAPVAALCFRHQQQYRPHSPSRSTAAGSHSLSSQIAVAPRATYQGSDRRRPIKL